LHSKIATWEPMNPFVVVVVLYDSKIEIEKRKGKKTSNR
jgi:hypothetical protein